MAGSGQLYTFSDTVTDARTIANIIRIIEPQDTPCISYFGLNNQSKFRMQNWPNPEYEWLEDSLRTRTATGAEALDNSETALDVATGHGVRFGPGDVWLVEETGEKIWVSSVSTDEVTVVRGFGDTSATAGTDETPTFTYLYTARLEGAESTPSWWTTPTSVTNYAQIFHAELKVSGSEKKASTRLGISDMWTYQLQKILGGAGSGSGRMGRAGDLMIDLENTFFTGEKVQRTATVPGAMGTFKEFVTTNVTALAGRRLELDDIEDALATAWTYGGKPDTIIVNSFNKRLISSWFSGSVRTTRDESTGGIIVNNIDTEFGTLNVMMNRYCQTDHVYILQRDLMGWVALRPWHVHPLAVSGDYVKEEVLGEFGFVLQSEKAHALITGTATS